MHKKFQKNYRGCGEQLLFFWLIWLGMTQDINGKPWCLRIKAIKMMLPWNGSWIHWSLNKKTYSCKEFSWYCCLGDQPLEGHHGVWQSPIQLSFRKSIIFINPTSTCIMILSSIQLPRSLCAYHQSCFHLQ